jgi:hypothetical protein
MTKELRTVVDTGGIPLLELVKESGVLVIYEAGDMDRHIQFPQSAIPALISYLEDLK